MISKRSRSRGSSWVQNRIVSTTRKENSVREGTYLDVLDANAAKEILGNAKGDAARDVAVGQEHAADAVDASATHRCVLQEKLKVLRPAPMGTLQMRNPMLKADIDRQHGGLQHKGDNGRK